MKEKKMVALSVGKKSKLGALSSMLAKTIGVVSLVAILASCGTSPGYSYTVGGTVSGLAGSGLVLQNNGGDDRSLSANGAFSFPTPLSDTSAYTITVKTQPTTPSQICTVNNGTGTINGEPAGDVVVNCMTGSASIAFSSSGAAEFAYVEKTNGTISDGTISAYAINTTNGTLSPLGTPVAAGKFPASITVAGGFAYVANMSDNTISAYTISGGTLAASTITPTVTAGTNPTSIVTVSVGSSVFAYATNTSGCTISAYSIGTDGSLNELTAIGSPFSTGTGTYPTSITVDPSGKFAYVVNADDGSISVYKINLDGTLTPQ